MTGQEAVIRAHIQNKALGKIMWPYAQDAYDALDALVAELHAAVAERDRYRRDIANALVASTPEEAVRLMRAALAVSTP